MSTTRMLPLINYKYPDETVLVYKQDKTWSAFTPTQYQDYFKSTLVHGVVYKSGKQELISKIQKQVFATNEEKSEAHEANHALANFIEQPIQNFYVSYVNSICGHGIIANKNLSANTIIGTYSSELLVTELDETIGNQQARVYDMGAGDYSQINIKASVKHNENYRLRFRALDYGDLTRFALHAPPAQRIADLKNHGYIDPAINEKNILTENTMYYQGLYHNVPIRYFQTKKSITKYSLILINYGDEYWIKERAPQAELNINRNLMTLGLPCLFLKNNPTKNILQVLRFDTYIKKYKIGETISLPEDAPVISPQDTKSEDFAKSPQVSPTLFKNRRFSFPKINSKRIGDISQNSELTQKVRL